MKAIVYERYGSPEVLQIIDMPKPQPKANELLIEVRATTVTSADCRVRAQRVPRGFGLIMRLVFGLTKPRQPILGSELSGEVVAVGDKVTRFKVGDSVVAFTDAKMGCYVQYKCMPEEGVVILKPANLSHEQAAALSFSGTTALHFLKQADLKAGETLLINGASGAVGMALIRLAKHYGAHVTAVCSESNAGLVAKQGADQVIDYQKQDVTQTQAQYDVIIDTTGNFNYSVCRNLLNKGGRLVLAVAELTEMFSAGRKNTHKVIIGTASGEVEDLQRLAELATSGKFIPYIDRVYPYQQIQQAHLYVDTGHKKGNVVVSWE